jgi:hypothetical protein
VNHTSDPSPGTVCEAGLGPLNNVNALLDVPDRPRGKGVVLFISCPLISSALIITLICCPVLKVTFDEGETKLTIRLLILAPEVMAEPVTDCASVV